MSEMHELNEVKGDGEVTLKEKRVLSKALIRTIENFDLKVSDVSKIIRISESVISRFKKGEKEHVFSRNEQFEFTVIFLRSLGNLFDFFGGDTQNCHEWIVAHHDIFGKPPLEEMKTIDGLKNVECFLERFVA